MYYHIERAKFITIEVNRKTFNKIFARQLEEIILEKNKSWERKLSEQNEFLRLIHDEWYMDVSIRKTVCREEFVIHIGKIIDCNRPNRENK